MSDQHGSGVALLDVFGDPTARDVLLLASRGPVTAAELADRLDVSVPTVYRRINTLAEYDLIHATLQTDREGHHYRLFETAVTDVSFQFREGKLRVDLRLKRDLVDRFQGFFDGIGQSSPDIHLELVGAHQPDRSRDGVSDR